MHVFWAFLSLQKIYSRFLSFFELAKNQILVFLAFLKDEVKNGRWFAENSTFCKNHVGLQPKWPLRVFELKRWSSNQNSSILSGKFIGAHQKCARTLGRALRAPKVETLEKFMKNSIFMMCLFWRAARVQVSAQNIQERFLLIQEMLFDYLIAILAQKLVKIDFHEVGSFSKISKIFKKINFFQQKFDFWQDFIQFYFHQFLS